MLRSPGGRRPSVARKSPRDLPPKLGNAFEHNVIIFLADVEGDVAGAAFFLGAFGQFFNLFDADHLADFEIRKAFLPALRRLA